MPLMRRRPILRGAMVAGAGYAAGKHVSNRRAEEDEQEQRLADLETQQQPQYAEPAPASGRSMDQKVEDLTQLKTLLDSGVLTQEEFDAQKQQILSS